MRTLVEAATGPPTILLTAALVVILGFWLLVAVGAAAPDSFDADVDLGRWGLGGMPVAVALSSLTALSWALSVGATSALAAWLPEGVWSRPVVPLGAVPVAWWVLRRVVRLLHRRSGEARGRHDVTLG